MTIKNPIDGIKIGDKIKFKLSDTIGKILDINKSHIHDNGGLIKVQITQSKCFSSIGIVLYWYGKHCIIIKPTNLLCKCELDILMSKGCQCGGT